jgi:hypothetical protein
MSKEYDGYTNLLEEISCPASDSRSSGSLTVIVDSLHEENVLSSERT